MAFIPSYLVKATFSHYRTAPEGTRVTPVTGAPPEPRCRKRPAAGRQQVPPVPPEEPHPLAIMVRVSILTGLHDRRWVWLLWRDSGVRGGALGVGVTVVAAEAVRWWLKVAFTK